VDQEEHTDKQGAGGNSEEDAEEYAEENLVSQQLNQFVANNTHQENYVFVE